MTAFPLHGRIIGTLANAKLCHFTQLSLCVDSCCMSFRKALSAFGITGFSVVPYVKKGSDAAVNSWALPRTSAAAALAASRRIGAIRLSALPGGISLFVLTARRVA